MPKSNTEYWHSKINRNRARDAEVNRQYEDLDWQAVRIWEHTINERFDQAIDALTAMLDERYELTEYAQ